MLSKNDTIFQINMAKNVTQDFVKYKYNAKLFCHIFIAILEISHFFNFHAILICIDKHSQVTTSH